MRKVIIGLGVVFILLIAAALIIPSLIPSSVYKDKIEAQLSQELARDVSIVDDVKLSVFPLIKAKIGRVIIANPDGFTAENFAQMDGLDARVKLWPLLSKKVEIASFTLLTPVINLEKTADGSANWVFGTPGAQDQAPEPDTGPFKRDGRYATLDPAIGTFSLKDGSVFYSDATTETQYSLTAANLRFALPSLSQAVSVNGDAIFDGTPMDVKVKLDTPRAFLDGKRAPIDASIKTDFANISAKGAFEASEDIAFTLTVNGDISDVKKLTDLIPQEIPYTELAKTVDISGDFIYDGQIISAKGADIAIDGDILTARFTGDARLEETPTANGAVDVSIADPAALAKALDQDIKGLDLAETVTLKANLTAKDKGFSANNIDASVKGPLLSANFNGSGDYSETLSLTGDVKADITDIRPIVTRLDLDIPQAKALEKVTLDGTLNYAGDIIDMTIKSASADSAYLNGTYSGTVKQTGDDITANGTFNADIPSVVDLAKIATLEIDGITTVNKVSTSGQITYAKERTTVKNLSVKADGGTVNGTYTGDVSYSDTLTANGAFDAIITSMSALNAATKADIPYADAIGQITAKGNVSAEGEALSVQSLSAALSGGLLNGDFTGSATLGDAVSVNGQLNADIPSVRKLAETTGTTLPASTETGAIFEAFKASGTVSGTTTKLTIKDAAIALDDLSGKGVFSVDMSGVKPNLAATLTLPGLDIRPYMAAYTANKPQGDLPPWSEEPINAEALKSVDGTFKLSTPNIVTDRMSLGQSDINVTLKNGVMQAGFPNLALYSGLGTMSATLDASRAVPSIDFGLDLSKLDSNGFLSAATGFTNASGQGGLKFNIRSQGTSQAAIMRALNGSGNFDMKDGQIAGVDLSLLMQGLEQSLTSRSLPQGIGDSYVTKFKDMAGLFTIENGVAKISEFDMQGFGVAAKGGGSIDVGAQSMDFSLQPRLTTADAGLAGLGIPLRFKGQFGQVSAGLDTDLLGKIVADKAKARAKQELSKALGGSVNGQAGDILGSVLGGQSTDGNASGGDIGSALGGLLGGGSTQKAPTQGTQAQGTQTQGTQAPQKAPKVEDAIGSLFGISNDKEKPAQEEKEPEKKKKKSSIFDLIDDVTKDDD